MPGDYDPTNRKRAVRSATDWDVIGRLTDLPAPVRRHVAQVYAHLARLAGVASASCFFSTRTSLLGVLQHPLILFGALMFCSYQIYGTEPTPLTVARRRNYSYAYAALIGVSLQPFVDLAVLVNPSVITMTLIVTFLVFASFSVTALRTQSRSLLYLGGLLSSLLSYMVIGNLVNHFFLRSMSFMFAEMYLGIAIFCGFVMFSTQIMVRDAEDGNMDVVGHAMGLFSDMVNLFIRIGVLLLDRERESKEKRRRR